MIQTINSNGGCCTKNSTKSNAYPHTHDDRYYTESEIDKKLSDLQEEVDDIKEEVDASNLQKTTDKGNTTDKGISLVNGSLTTDFKQKTEAVKEAGINSYNGENLGKAGVSLVPQEENNLNSSSVLFTEIKNDLDEIEVLKIELLIEEGQKKANINSTFSGSDAEESSDFVTKRQLDATLDNLLELGEDA